MYEICLFLVECEYRNGRVLLGLICFLYCYLFLNGYELVFIFVIICELVLYE